MLVQIKTKKGKKGRTFRAELLAWIDAPTLFEAGDTGPNQRPVWITVASSELEAKAFQVNFKNGEIAENVKGGYTTERWQLLKKAGYASFIQKIGGGVVTTYYLPELFDLNPGMVDPDGIRFIMLPGQGWFDNQELSEEDAEALLFLAYLDRRTRFPFPPDVEFAKSLLVACIELGFATRAQSPYAYREQFKYVEHDFDSVGLRGGLAFNASHGYFGEVLSDEIKKWHEGQE